MKRIPTALPGVVLLEPVIHRDARGHVLERYNARAFQEMGIYRTFVQDNESSSACGVLRGLHYQLECPQAKLFSVHRGTVLDVAVDLRRGSPTFGRWVSEVLSGENHRMLFIPEGFAHGFYVLSERADCIYKCSDFYSPSDERGVLWSDPTLGITWPIQPGLTPILSAKDQTYPNLTEIQDHDLPMYR